MNNNISKHAEEVIRNGRILLDFCMKSKMIITSIKLKQIYYSIKFYYRLPLWNRISDTRERRKPELWIE